MKNPYDQFFVTALDRTMKELASAPPAPIVDNYMLGGEAVSGFGGKDVPPEKWVVWFGFADERSLRLAREEKCALISRKMMASLKDSGLPADVAEEVEIRFTSSEAIEKAGGETAFLEAALLRDPVVARGTGRWPKPTPVPPTAEGGPLRAVGPAAPSSSFWVPDAPSQAALLGIAAVLVAFFGVFAGLPELPKWTLAGVLAVASAVVAYRHRRGKAGRLLDALVRATEGLGFRALADPRESLGRLGILGRSAFRGQRVSWALGRAAPTGRTILAGAPRSAFDDVHHLVMCWSLAGSPLPDFELSPGSVALGRQDIDFETDPEFSDRYRLRGRDEDAVRRIFRAEVREFFTRPSHDEDFLLVGHEVGDWRKMDLVTEGWYAESRGGWLIVYRPHPRAERAVGLLPVYLEMTQELFDLVTARR